MKHKILIDSRRKVNSGVGRVSQWLSENLVFDKNKIEVINLVKIDSPRVGYEFHNNRLIETKITPFSREEYYDLPNLVASICPDLYINPQTTWSPLHKIPSINIVHDLWAIKNPEWLPSSTDLEARFEICNTEYFNKLVEWFDERKAKSLLTEYGFEEWCRTKSSGNIIHLGCWAQYAATVSLSAKCVTVSEYIKTEIEKYFRLGHASIVISNMPKNLNDSRNEKKNNAHFLTLSKLEGRKNLDYLLDSYKEYCQRSPRPLPLIIAGDPGYISVAEKILKNVSRMNEQGYSVSFRESVTDHELSKLFAQACALVFPTHFEGFGLPALEGMLSGIPVIATKTGMMATPLGQHASIISGDNTAELADKLVKAQEGSLDVCEVEAESAVRKFIGDSNSKAEWKKLIQDTMESHIE